MRKFKAIPGNGPMRVIAVLDSCKTREQVLSAARYVGNYCKLNKIGMEEANDAFDCVKLKLLEVMLCQPRAKN